MRKNISILLMTLVYFLLACNSNDKRISPETTTPTTNLSATTSDGSGIRSLDGSSKSRIMSISTSSDAYAEDKSINIQKLIYNSEMEIIVKDFQDAENKIKSTAELFGGYIQETRSFKNEEGKFHGSLKIRVLSKNFREAITKLSTLGEVKSIREWTEDVTEEYIDVNTRIENAEKLEKRLLSLIENKDGKLPDIVSVETKLADVRTQIEQYKGKLRYLKNRLDFSTITISIYEPSSSLAKQESIFYPFAWAMKQLGTIFFGSLGVFVMIIAGLTPWIVVVFIIIKIVRYRRKKKSTNAD